MRTEVERRIDALSRQLQDSALPWDEREEREDEYYRLLAEAAQAEADDEQPFSGDEARAEEIIDALRADDMHHRADERQALEAELGAIYGRLGAVPEPEPREPDEGTWAVLDGLRAGILAAQDVGDSEAAERLQRRYEQVYGQATEGER